MQLKLTLSLSITRDRRPEPAPDAPEPPTILNVAGAQVEHAGYQPIGFQIEPTNTF